MVIKWGFGVEKETSFIGFNNPLTDFSSKGKYIDNLRFGHNENQLKKIGKFAYLGSDITVYRQNQEGKKIKPGLEFGIYKKYVTKNPKKVIMGFAKDVNNAAKEYVYPDNLKNKICIPFGSVPGVNSKQYKDTVPGSYHMNLTMPYDTETTIEKRKIYSNKLKKGLLNVRAIQPLLFAFTGGTTVDSIGNPPHLEGSQRMLYSERVSGIGTKDIKNFDDFIDTIITTPGNLRDSGRSSANTNDKWREELKEKFPEIKNSGYDDFRIKEYVNNVPTVELRFFDTFDTRGLYDIFKSVVSTMENGENFTSDPKTEAVWKNAMKTIAEEGWDSQVDIEYAKYLKEKLKIKFDIPDDKTIRADILGNLVFKALWEKNKKGEWVKPWSDDKAPEIHNFNKDSWEFYFLQELKRRTNLLKKFKKFLMILTKLDASASTNKIKVRLNSKGFTIRDIILDENVFGMDIGAEDTEDLLYFLERYKFIQTYQDEAGKIIEIKKSWSTEDEMNKLIENMLNEKNILNENQIGLISQSEIDEMPEEPEPIEEPEVRSTIRPIPPIRTRDRMGDRIETQVDFSNLAVLGILKIKPYEGQGSDAVTTNIRDLEYLFDYANFIYQTHRIYVKVILVNKITNISETRTFNSAWGEGTRNSNNIYLFIDESFSSISQTNVDLDNWIEKMDVGLVDNLGNREIFSDSMTRGQFFDKIREIRRTEFKGQKQQNKIQLTAAGIERLKNMGIFIGSIERGKKYILLKYKKGMSSKIKILNNVPYWKEMHVIVGEEDVKLMKNNIIIHRVIK